MARTIMTAQRFEEIKRMLEVGMSVREISQTKKATRRTVRQIRDGVIQHPGIPKELPGPIWAHQICWDEVIKEACDGHPLKFIWSERAGAQVGYKAFLEQFYRQCPEFKKATVVHRVFNPGEHCEVDYAGTTIDCVNPRTGEVLEVPVFIGALGCSQLIFAYAQKDAKSAQFIDCHARMYEAFGGVPKVTVPDCLKTGVIKTHLYDPDLNPSYADMAEHYNTAIVPARTRRPKDKAIVEGSVKLVMRLFKWIYRGHTFTSVEEINEALRAVTEVINNKPHSRFKISRQQRWVELEKPALQPLPQAPYEYTETKTATVHPDSHLSVDRNHYSVPHSLRGHKLTVKITSKQVRVFKDLECVAVHPKAPSKKGLFVTQTSHLPPNARAYHEATPQSLLSQARFLSSELHSLLDEMFKDNALGEIRRAQGLLSQAKKEVNTSGSETALKIIKKSIETMRAYNKVRVPYFKDLLNKYRKEAAKASFEEIKRDPNNPMLRYNKNSNLTDNPKQKGKDNGDHLTH